ncbi:hypothetical protein AOLI_G00190480 [Acnodon oligacanthus]
MAASAGKQGSPAEGATTQTVTGGSKPLHRFLRAEPKTVGIALILMGCCLFMFGIPLKMEVLDNSSNLYSSFWLGILYFMCGVVYILAERGPTKKTVTASLALSIISILGSIFAAIDFIKGLVFTSVSYRFRMYDLYSYNVTHLHSVVERHYTSVYSLEAVFLFHSLIGGVILIVMTVFARVALRSSRTQTVVVMRNLPSAE